jgi:Effector-associated domain 9
LTDAQKRRLQQRQQALESERSLRAEKLGMLRKSWAIETQAAVKFQLTQQIQEEETQIKQLEQDLDAIEAQLSRT